MSQRLRGSIHRPDLSVVLLCIEAVVVFAALVLFGVAYPDRFRSRLWRNGGEQGWCSNPRMRIYFYANHEEPPEIPLIWSQRLTTSDMATAVLGATIFFARLTMAVLQYEARWTNLAYDAFLGVLWACSAAAQNEPDLSDPHHFSERPWYLTRSCDEAWPENRGWCMIAKWEYAWSIFAAFFYVARVVGTLSWSLYEKGRRDGFSTGCKALSLSECDPWTEECEIALYMDDA
ncbi:hypothetical protein CABS01_02073 [Colletotrichum abscissum]|nr:uncharacterized protein CABS01_02073 [Colletotrichum abscissum]KAI3528318.1 hypothetical protein CABS02_15144 [Colletotrichum abscissum]KAK1488443.1 hypothetical protein CABS01_02073 [Colletotrichum abscissum]KAK1704855.1 hypothetical protein BDP67DRAFT_209218 [Colletotrichum lupini]